jgi:hypothetical protein
MNRDGMNVLVHGMNELSTYERERVYSALTLIATRLFGGRWGGGEGEGGKEGEETARQCGARICQKRHFQQFFIRFSVHFLEECLHSLEYACTILRDKTF